MKQIKIAWYGILLCLILSSQFFGQGIDSMAAHFIDVGQGQAILLEFPKGAVLIDAGGVADRKGNLVIYLGKFFARRTDLNRTLSTVFIAHQHVDHDEALQDVANSFTILNYVDNGQHIATNSGKEQIWMEQNAPAKGVRYEAVTFDKVTAGHNRNGITDDIIDPFSGPDAPKITVYSGAFKTGELDATDMHNANDHSLVIKVSFGKASFQFSGDLEASAIAAVLKYYAGTPALQADVLQVGHHGSANGITAEWANAVSPQYAVISCGQWNYGENTDGTAKSFTTYAYAHPNRKALTILENAIPGLRPLPLTEHVGITGSYPGHPTPVWGTATITHNIYATAWNGNISIKASTDGVYTVATDK